MPDVIDLANAFRSQLDAHDAQALGRIANAYGAITNRLVDLIDALALEIETGGYSVNKVR